MKLIDIIIRRRRRRRRLLAAGTDVRKRFDKPGREESVTLLKTQRTRSILYVNIRDACRNACKKIYIYAPQ